jgi:hypothetical protein
MRRHLIDIFCSVGFLYKNEFIAIQCRFNALYIIATSFICSTVGIFYNVLWL